MSSNNMFRKNCYFNNQISKLKNSKAQPIPELDEIKNHTKNLQL